MASRGTQSRMALVDVSSATPVYKTQQHGEESEYSDEGKDDRHRQRRRLPSPPGSLAQSAQSFRSKVTAGGQAQRAARRYLVGFHRKVSGPAKLKQLHETRRKFVRKDLNMEKTLLLGFARRSLWSARRRPIRSTCRLMPTRRGSIGDDELRVLIPMTPMSPTV